MRILIRVLDGECRNLFLDTLNPDFETVISQLVRLAFSHAYYAMLVLMNKSDGYTFLFEPNPDWSKFYAPQPEIQAYIKRTVAKYNLDKYVSLKSKVLETVWDDEVGKWKIKVDVNGVVQDDEADILLNGSGFLKSVLYWPS